LQGNGQLLIELVPELALIIGAQPTLTELPAEEARNRFNSTIGNFLQSFGQQNSILTIFIDDLQWADIGSIQLLQHLVEASYSTHLFMITAFRDNGILASHPLNQLLAEIKKTKAFNTHIKLLPLDACAIGQFMASTLSLSVASIQPLVNIVFEKTDGNPFFIREFIKSLIRTRNTN